MDLISTLPVSRSDKAWWSITFDLARIAAPTRRCHWISTPDGDQGYEWCPSCGRAKVRNLRRHDRRRRRDYILDGGWRTDHDHMPMCQGCGAYLDGSLTQYGALDAIEYYRENGLSTEPGIDALYLSEIINGLDHDEDAEDIDFALSLANKLLAERC